MAIGSLVINFPSKKKSALHVNATEALPEARGQTEHGEFMSCLFYNLAKGLKQTQMHNTKEAHSYKKGRERERFPSM